MSTKTVAQKLLIKPGSTLWVSPEVAPDLIGALPDAVTSTPDLEAADVALLGVSSAATARAVLETYRSALTGPAVLWVLYPKGNVTDINRDSLWKLLEPYGLRPITQVAVDATWSALRFRPLKPGEAPFNPGKPDAS